MGLFKRKKDKNTKETVVDKTIAKIKTAGNPATSTTVATKSKATVAKAKPVAKEKPIAKTKPATKAKPATAVKNTKVKTIDDKKAAVATDKKQPTNVYYVTTRMQFNKKVGWEIKRGNAAKVSAVVTTKEAAKAKVKDLAKNSKASVVIYRLDGSVEETYKINE